MPRRQYREKPDIGADIQNIALSNHQRGEKLRQLWFVLAVGEAAVQQMRARPDGEFALEIRDPDHHIADHITFKTRKELVHRALFPAQPPAPQGTGPREAGAQAWMAPDHVAQAHSAASAMPASGSISEDSSTLRPRLRISLTSTLKLSGMPASKVSSPLTIAS